MCSEWLVAATGERMALDPIDSSPVAVIAASPDAVAEGMLWPAEKVLQAPNAEEEIEGTGIEERMGIMPAHRTWQSGGHHIGVEHHRVLGLAREISVEVGEIKAGDLGLAAAGVRRPEGPSRAPGCAKHQRVAVTDRVRSSFITVGTWMCSGFWCGILLVRLRMMSP